MRRVQSLLNFFNAQCEELADEDGDGRVEDRNEAAAERRRQPVFRRGSKALMAFVRLKKHSGKRKTCLLIC